MDTVTSIESEEDTAAAKVASAAAVDEAEEDTGFLDVLASATDADASSSAVDTAKTMETLAEVETAAETLASEDTGENRIWFVQVTQEATKEVGATVEEANLESSEDLEKLKEVQVEIDNSSVDLAQKSDSLEGEGPSEVIDAASDLLADTGDSLEAIIEVSEVDAEKGDELAKVFVETLDDVGAALDGTGTPLEVLLAAGEIMRDGKAAIMELFEAFMGYAFMSMIASDAEEEEQQQRIISENTISKNAASDNVLDEDGNVSLSSGTMAAATGVDLSGWKLTLPADHDGDGEADEIGDDELKSFGGSPNIQHNADGSITFSSVSDEAATTANSNYPRAELREMIRAGDTSIDTSDPANNWVTSAASSEEQAAAGGVDGQMQATLSVDRVTEQGDPEQAGRVIIGQVHAMEDEPVRLYFHKSPDSEKGAIYFAHEPQNGEPETFHELIGDKTGMAPDGIALGETFTYNIDITGTDLTVSVTTADGQTYAETVDIGKSGYADAGTQMYFKAGVYSQNDTTPDPSVDYAEATFYSLETVHDGEALGSGAPIAPIFDPQIEEDDDSGEYDGFSDEEGAESEFGSSGSDESDGSDETDSTPATGGGLSTESSTDGDPSAENQAALEGRYIALYERLMEKQIAFKEAVEPYKTDNQNAGKG